MIPRAVARRAPGSASGRAPRRSSRQDLESGQLARRARERAGRVNRSPGAASPGPTTAAPGPDTTVPGGAGAAGSSWIGGEIAAAAAAFWARTAPRPKGRPRSRSSPRTARAALIQVAIVRFRLIFDGSSRHSLIGQCPVGLGRGGTERPRAKRVADTCSPGCGAKSLGGSSAGFGGGVTPEASRVSLLSVSARPTAAGA